MRFSLSLLLLLSSLSSFELRYGRGDFDMDMKMSGFMKCSQKLDIETISLVNTHDNIARSRFYIFYDIDIYRSDYVDSKIDMVEDMISMPTSLMPEVLSDRMRDFVPIPSDIRVGGIDMNIGGGFDILESDEGYLGVGLSTGISAPYIHMKNGSRLIAPIIGAMRATDTTMTSWKSSLTLQGEYRLFDRFSISGSALYGYQFAQMENGWIKSEIDMEGVVTALDIALRYSLGDLAEWTDGITLSMGVSSKSWDSDSVEVKLMDSLFEKEMSSTMDMAFDTVNYYMGIGYRF